MANVTERFLSYLFDKQKEMGETQIDKARLCLLDYDAVTYAGALRNAARWRAFLAHAGTGGAELCGYGRRTDSRTAAFVNGFNAHSLELDDGHRIAMIHLGASIISALNAAEADFRFSLDDKLRGVVMGYETACRIAMAMQPSHKRRGFHAAGTCGTIGAAVGVAFAEKMDREQMKRVITAAAGSAAGMLEIQEQSSELKPYNLGRAAMDGLIAACMGLTDFDSPDDMLGGERGLFQMFSDCDDCNKLTEAQPYFEIERIYLKPYASCRHSHSAVEAAIRLHSEITVESIAYVTVRTYELGVKGHDHSEIQGNASAKLSTPYAVAAALLYGRADLPAFEPLDMGAVALARKVHVTEDEALTRECPGKRIAVVTVHLTDGSARSCRVDTAKGEPENPMTELELRRKWESLKCQREMTPQL